MSQIRTGTIALFVVSLPVLVGVFVYGPFVLDLFLHRRPPSRFLIPAGYVGWVRVEYRVAGAPALPREGKYQMVRIEKDGGARTSSDLPEGWGRDQFFYDSTNARQPLSNAGWCKGGMIWDEARRQRRQGGALSEVLRGDRGPVSDGGRSAGEDVQSVRVRDGAIR